jgi:hypothetical protein
MSDKNASKCKVCRECGEADGNVVWKPSFKMWSNMSMDAYNVCENCEKFLKAEEQEEQRLNRIICDGTDVDLEQYAMEQEEQRFFSNR